MKKLILSNEEFDILEKVLSAIPPAHLPRFLPDWNGVDMFYYRRLLTKILRKDFSFPKTDDDN